MRGTGDYGVDEEWNFISRFISFSLTYAAGPKPYMLFLFDRTLKSSCLPSVVYSVCKKQVRLEVEFIVTSDFSEEKLIGLCRKVCS